VLYVMLALIAGNTVITVGRHELPNPNNLRAAAARVRAASLNQNRRLPRNLPPVF
jgi:hypothetical protein